MRTKWLLVMCLSLIVVLCFSFSVFSQQPKTIKIGAVYPLTGNIASTGLDCRRGAELAAGKMPAPLSGGTQEASHAAS